LQIKISGEPVHIEILVPQGPARLRELLPVLEGLTDTVVELATRQVEREGKSITCKKGCGACCRQLVPISAAEAHNLAELVGAMPQRRQAEVRHRFAEARERLEAAGLLGQLQNPDRSSGRELRPLGLSYFGLGIACPFLEEESCSIHRERPLACREYLVTSPAENCARPTAESVHCVPMPAKVSSVAQKLEKPRPGYAAGWLPLILALDWANTHAEPPPNRSGPILIKELFSHLAKESQTDNRVDN
jgi:Fe-S-cluster containining protein